MAASSETASSDAGAPPTAIASPDAGADGPATGKATAALPLSGVEYEILSRDGGLAVVAPGGDGADAGFTAWELTPPQLLQPSVATYPENLSGGRPSGTVSLELTVGETGTVEDVTLLASVHPALDEAAVRAAHRLRFLPARLADTPVAVRLRYDYVFVAPVPKAVLQGELRTRGTRRRIPGVLLSDGKVLVETDASGRFSLELPPGELALTIRAAGHAELPVKESLTEGQVLTVVYRLESLQVSPYETVVRDQTPRAEVSRHTLVAQELREVPGTMGDPFRAIMTLPGVSTVASGVAYPVVRGSQPAATGYFVDGVQVPVLFHLALGPAVVHPEFLERVDFHPGAAPLRYGRLLGGAVDGQVRRPREDRLHLSGYADLVNAGLFVEAPSSATGTSVTLSGRLSYTAWLAERAMGLLSPETAGKPQLDFWDYQGRIEQKLPGGGRLRLLALGSSDRVGMLFDDPEAVDATFGLLFHRLDLSYRTPLPLGELELAATWGQDLVAFEAGSEAQELASDYGLRTSILRARASWSATLAQGLQLTVGADLEHRRSQSTLSVSPPAAEEVVSYVQPLTLATLSGAYAEAVWSPSASWTLAGGVRGDIWHLVPGIQRYSVDPRVVVTYRPLPQLELTGGVGRVHQAPTVLVNVPVFDVAGLRHTLQEATKVDLAGRWSLPNGLELSLGLYYSHLDRTLELDLFQVFQNERTLGLFAPELITWGRAYGMELMLRHPLGNNWFGWLTYSLQHASRYETFVEFDDAGSPLGVTSAEVPFAFDQTHTFNAALSHTFPGDLTAGVSLHFNTGRPESGRISSRTQRPWTDPVTGADTWRLVGRDQVDRLPPFFRVDARVAKKWAFDEFQLEAYLDIMNVTLSREVLSYDYCEESRPCANTLYGKEAPFSLPVVVPMLGLKGTY